MARFNEILTGRLNRALQKFTGIKGTAPTPQLGTEFLPVFPLFWGAENRYLESWNRFGFYQEQAGGAGVFFEMRLRNPANSGIVTVVEKVQAACTIADQFELSQGAIANDLTNVFALTGTRFDNRGNPTTAMLASSRQTAGSSALGLRAKAYLGANATVDLIVTDIQEMPLLPGDAIHVRSFTLNDTVAIGFWWRERILEESEKF